MPIDQNSLDEAASNAIACFVKLLPTMAGEVSINQRTAGIEITIANPYRPERPLAILTEGRELTVCFAQSHYHISDYGQEGTAAELVEQMILGIAGIINGDSNAYSSYAGDRILGGGFMERSSPSEPSEDWWMNADRFVVLSWSGDSDRIISR